MIVPGNIQNFSFVDDSYSVFLPSGVYKIECWGASGGSAASGSGGEGGFVSGFILFRSPIELFVFPGGSGQANGLNSYNGGGRGGIHFGNMMASGGGGTDVRLHSNDLSSRIIVAGGGGGSASNPTSYTTTGGSGGGIIGGNGTKSGANIENLVESSGGTQISGGYGSPSGSFGFGGNSSGFAGGGGGYYGGGATTLITSTISAGGGGSSFISGHSGCKAYQKEDEFHPSGHIFTQTIIHNGNEYFYSPYNIFEEGHHGDGYVRITFIYKYYYSLCVYNNPFNTYIANFLYIMILSYL